MKLGVRVTLVEGMAPPLNMHFFSTPSPSKWLKLATPFILFKLFKGRMPLNYKYALKSSIQLETVMPLR